MQGFSPEDTRASDLRDKIAYTIGSLGKDLVFGVLSCCLFLYCTQELKLDSSFLGVLFLTNIVIGILLSPVVGFLLDHTYTRFGKYKPWIVGSIILNLIALIIFYNLPQYGLAVGDRIIYVSGIYTLWSVSFLMLDLPSWAMLSLFNTNNNTRDSMSQVPNFTQVVGKQIFILTTLPLMDRLPSWLNVDTSTYVAAVIACSIIILVSQTIFVLLLHPTYNNHLLLRASVSRNMSSAAAGTASAAPAAAPAPACAAAADASAALLASSSMVSFHEMPHPSLWQSLMRLFFSGQSLHCNTLAPMSSGNPRDSAPREGLLTQAQVAAHAHKRVHHSFFGAEKEGKEGSGSASTIGGASGGYSSDVHEASASSNFWGKAPRLLRTGASLRATVAGATARGVSPLMNERSESPLIAGALSPSSGAIVQAELEGYSPEMQASAKSPFQLRSMAQVVTKNDQLHVVFLSTFLLFSIYGLILGGFVSLFLDRERLFSPSVFAIIIVGTLTHLATIASFELLVRSTSRKVIFNLSLVLMLLGFTLMLVLQNTRNDEIFLPLLLSCYILSCAGIGLSKVSITSMTIDTVDYGEFKLSVRADGLIFGLRNVAYKAGELIGFFYYSNAVFTIFGQSPQHLGLSFNLNLAVILVIILLTLTFLIYLHLYKLNGAFYRNVLNNLQYLKQNQRWHSHSPTTNRFMLRYALDESTMIIKLKAKNVDDLTRAMVQKLSEVNAITSEHDYMADLKKRLRQGDCGIAEGIALPHAKSSAVRRATVVVATLDTPLDLGALDGRKCDLIFLLASPDDGFTHLNLLGRLSLLLNEPNFADKLRASGSPTELFERLIQCEKHLVR